MKTKPISPILLIDIFLLTLVCSYLYVSKGVTRPSPKEVLMKKLERKGFIDAEADIAEGHLFFKWGGRLWDYDPNYWALLEQKYNIVWQFRGDGTVDPPEERAYYTSYNERSEAEIARRFGPEIFLRTREEAKRLSEQGVRLYQNGITSERDEPYTVTMDPMPPFPEKLFVKGTFGQIYLAMRVAKNGRTSGFNVMDMRIFRGPFLGWFNWWPAYEKFPQISYSKQVRNMLSLSEKDSLRRLLQPWIDRYRQAMHVRVNPGYWRWLYNDSLYVWHEIKIGDRALENDQAVAHVPDVDVPASLIQPLKSVRINVLLWYDRSGRILNWRFILIRDTTHSAYGLYCSMYDFDDFRSPMRGEVDLVKRLTPWVQSVIPRITLEVKRDSKYFDYFDVGFISVTLPKER